MTWAVLVINIKGGTGKSTIAEELSTRLRDEGYEVGIIDADIDSSNLSTRFGVTQKVSFKGDHTVEPVEHEGMKLYSMENAFDESSFAQSGEFMSTVINDMVNYSDWGDLDYMVVDCPPGSSDIFAELVRALRTNILGAVSVGIPDAVEDTNRLVKVCNHEWVPILGFVENMSGVYCHDEPVECDNAGFSPHEIEPFGSGDIEKYAKNINGNFFGSIPLCVEDTEISKIADSTLNNMIEEIEAASSREGWPQLPDDNMGDESFIRNVWKTVKVGINRMNETIDVGELQESYGVEGRDPLVIEMELTDAAGIGSVLSSIIITVDKGSIKPVNPIKKGMNRTLNPDGGIKITSQDLYDAIRGKKKVMRSVTGEVIEERYSIIDAVKMGDAEVWGDRTVNRLAALDRILSEAVDMDEVTDIVKEAD